MAKIGEKVVVVKGSARKNNPSPQQFNDWPLAGTPKWGPWDEQIVENSVNWASVQRFNQLFFYSFRVKQLA